MHYYVQLFDLHYVDSVDSLDVSFEVQSFACGLERLSLESKPATLQYQPVSS